YLKDDLSGPLPLGQLDSLGLVPSTQVGNSAAQACSYDTHGDIVQMPHLSAMEWDFKDRLHATQQQVVNNAAGEKTYYVYDGSGQRTRKITESSNGTRKKQRMYFAGFE